MNKNDICDECEFSWLCHGVDTEHCETYKEKEKKEK